MVHDDGVIRNVADGARVGHAAEALVWVLRDDPRVQAAFIAWLHLVSQAGLDRGRDLRILETLVREDLALSFAWLPELLYAGFGAMALEIATDQPHGLSMAPPELGLPPGRQPKHGDGKGPWDTLVRDVEWFYRATIKKPPDLVGSLAREYALSVGRSPRRHYRFRGLEHEQVVERPADAHSVVDYAIARVRATLAALSVEPE